MTKFYNLQQLELNDGYINLINPITVAPNHCDEQAATDEKENGADLETESVIKYE